MNKQYKPSNNQPKKKIAKKAKGIYAGDNPWGYRLNINDPEINKYYERFKKWKNVNSRYAISDAMRLEFEQYMIKHLKIKL